jgi:myosin heavy subunit
MSNQRCLVAHPLHIWTPGRLISKEGLNFNVLTDEGENVVGKEATPKEPATYLEISESTLNPVSDLCTLEELHAGLLLEHIRMRFMEDNIYTYIGPMVVSVNPFQKLTNIAGPEAIPQYLQSEREDMPPHLYHIGKKAFQSMCAFKESQSVIISGESGIVIYILSLILL